MLSDFPAFHPLVIPRLPFPPKWVKVFTSYKPEWRWGCRDARCGGVDCASQVWSGDELHYLSPLENLCSLNFLTWPKKKKYTIVWRLWQFSCDIFSSPHETSCYNTPGLAHLDIWKKWNITKSIFKVKLLVLRCKGQSEAILWLVAVNGYWNKAHWQFSKIYNFYFIIVRIKEGAVFQFCK